MREQKFLIFLTGSMPAKKLRPRQTDIDVQRRQIVRRACAITIVIVDALVTTHGKIAAGAGAIVVNCTGDVFADSSAKGDTAGGRFFRAGHTAEVRRGLQGQIIRNNSTRALHFAPIKRDAKKRATGAAG